MSKIGDIFVKDIERKMNPVIMAGDQSDEGIIFQELDEYVVTQEIDKNLEKFYKAFNDGVKNMVETIGVWVSGDFGSGKSHFLKILSYILKNDVIAGKKASEYLKEKVLPQTLSLMQTANRKHIDTILFDIDSESREGQNAENLVLIYLTVFNRMCGLSSFAAVADMERYLISEGKYDSFKTAFESVSGKSWESQRNKPAFIRAKIEKALLDCGACTNAEDAKRISDKTASKFEISSGEFAQLVKEHCESKGDDYVLVFLVDEVGQFISKKTQVMLKLQTITVDLCAACRGKVWNIVTSQEDMDMVFSGVNNNDFSKIQGRFSTRVKMSTSDVKEVIEERVLLKKPEYYTELSAYYEGERESIHNKLNFDNGMHIPLYKNKDDFARTYPFVSYQYGMLQTMLTELRDKSRAGKNISNAARSMLKTFKDTVAEYKDGDLKTVIPMYAFYDSLTSELDSPTLLVFNNASKNPELDAFDVNVLKTLFLVKYYSGLNTKVDNITAMMVSSFSENRLDLKKKVEVSMERLVKQNFVQRNAESYIFLTNEEQEVNLEIRRGTVDKEERATRISRVAFDLMGINGKFKYDNAHQYPFNKIIDTDNLDGTNHELSIKIFTPAMKIERATLSMESINAVVFELPPNDMIIQAFDNYILTNSYVNKNSGTDMSNIKRMIIDAKKTELTKQVETIKLMLKEALQTATVYINQSMENIPESDPVSRANIAVRRLIEMRYHKMNYIKKSKDRNAIEAMFKTRNLIPFDEFVGSEKLAVDDVLQYLNEQKSMNATVRMSDIMSKFERTPYGFSDDDISWIVGLLFRHNKLDMVMDGETYDGKKVDSTRAVDLLTKSKNYIKIELKLRDSVSSDSINRAVSVFNNILSKSLMADESKLVTDINSGSAGICEELDQYIRWISREPRYPWKDDIEKMHTLLSNTKSIGSPGLFKFIDTNEKSLLEVRSKLDAFKEFYAPDSKRRELFDKGLVCIRSFHENEAYLSADIRDIITSIEDILSSMKGIPELNSLCTEYNDKITEMIRNSKPEFEERIDELYDCHKGDFIEYGDLMVELTNERDESKRKIDGVTSIGDFQNIVSGFGFKIDGLIKRIPLPEQPPEKKDDSGEMPKPPVRKYVQARKLITVTVIDSEDDVDKLIASMKEKLMDNLKEGPFSIRTV